MEELDMWKEKKGNTEDSGILNWDERNSMAPLRDNQCRRNDIRSI